MDRHYIGLMSGTSADSIDAVVVNISADNVTLLESYSHPIPKDIQKKIWSLNQSCDNELKIMLELDQQLGLLFSSAVNNILKKSSIDYNSIIAIGSHGQTLRHYPNSAHPSTLQIADANVIVEKTGITTVSDFRRADIAAGGQGAPLVPAFHQHQYQHSEHHRVIVNIGGIANISYLPANQPNSIIGFDTGPGNGLMDEWIQKHQSVPFDKNGDWAKQGTVNKSLLNLFLEHPYFQKKQPKSTGRDIFNLSWVESIIQRSPSSNSIKHEDVQLTLCALTAHSIVNAINSLQIVNEVYICGGGVHNKTLIQLLNDLLFTKSILCQSTEKLGLHPDWVEACAFAWLAKQRINNLPGNCPTVTGARHHCVLGAIYNSYKL